MFSSKLDSSMLSTYAGLGLVPEAMKMNLPKTRCDEVQPFTNGVLVKSEPGEDILGSPTNEETTAEAHKFHVGKTNRNVELRAWPFDHNEYRRGINPDNITWADNGCKAPRPEQSKRDPPRLNPSALLSSLSSKKSKMDTRGGLGASGENVESVYKLYHRHFHRRVYQHCEDGTIHQFYRRDLEFEILNSLDKSKMPLNVKIAWYLEILMGDAFLGIWLQHRIDYNLPDDVIKSYEPDMSLTSYDVPEGAPKIPTSKEVLDKLETSVEGLQSVTSAAQGNTLEVNGTTDDTPAPPESDVEVSEMSDSSKPEGSMEYAVWAALRHNKQLKLDAVKEKAKAKAPKARARKPHPEASHPQPEAPMPESSKAKSKKRARDYEEGNSGTDEGYDGGYDPRNSKKRVRRISKSGSAARKRKPAKKSRKR